MNIRCVLNVWGKLKFSEVCPLDNLKFQKIILLGRVAQSITCLTTDACLTAYPGVASLIPAGSHTYMEIDHEITSPYRHRRQGITRQEVWGH